MEIFSLQPPIFAMPDIAPLWESDARRYFFIFEKLKSNASFDLETIICFNNLPLIASTVLRLIFSVDTWKADD
jgi:hypothetical protein